MPNHAMCIVFIYWVRGMDTSQARYAGNNSINEWVVVKPLVSACKKKMGCQSDVIVFGVGLLEMK